MRTIQRYRAFFKRYGLLRGLIVLSLTPMIKTIEGAVLDGLNTTEKEE